MILLMILCILLGFGLAFGWACLVTWALCFVLSLFGITLAFSWKLVVAVWIIFCIFNPSVIKIDRH